MKKIIISIVVIVAFLAIIAVGMAYSQKDIIMQESYNQYFETAENFSDDKRCYFNVSAEQQTVTGETISSLIFLQAELSNPQTVIPKTQIHNLMKDTIERGCEINDVDYNENLLVGAVIDNDLETFVFLIENGADPSLPIKATSPKIDGKNIFEFSALLETKQKNAERAIIDELVQSYKAQFDR